MIKIVTMLIDPTDLWRSLKEAYQLRDHSQVLSIMDELQSMKLNKGESVEDYLKKTRKLKNQLASMEEMVIDKAIIQLVLNGLPCSFESIIQTLTHVVLAMSLEQILASSVLEAYCREERNR